MSNRERHVELLLGRVVRDPDGRKVGRIEEMIAGTLDGEFVVTEFLLGGYGILERLGMLTDRSALKAVRWALRRLNGENGAGFSVRWDQIDLRDPERPVTTVPRGALQSRA